jgi:hypothetical protein
MVEINGSMVAPFGGNKQGNQPTFTSGDGKKHFTVDAPAGSLLAGSKDANNKQYGNQHRESRNRTLSIDRQKCTAIIYVHLSLVPNGNCKPDEVKATMKELEAAVASYLTNLKCPCDVKEGYSLTKNDGCTISVKLVWHDKPGPDVLPVTIICDDYDPNKDPFGQGPVSKGQMALTLAGKHMWQFASGRLGKDTQGYNIPSGPTYGHELGHNLFGNANEVPPSWRDPKNWPNHKVSPGHNPDQTGFLRDTSKNPLTVNDKMSNGETCALAEKWNLCPTKDKDCCSWEKASESHVAVVEVGRVRSVSTAMS